ncbi:MAG TPA: carbohydrate ABC transporter permease [Firmicutes bacterium]|nr:carbohydrate ABC transporter permease [Bacillota bacterium]
MSNYRLRRRLGRVALYICVILMGFFTVAPMVWIVITSLQPYGNLASAPPRVVPKDFNLSLYRELFRDSGFLQSLKNTAIITTVSTVVTVIFGTLAAYAAASYSYRGKNIVLFAVLSLQIAPAIVLLIPIFMLLRRFSLIDTYPGLILIFTLFMTPLAIWMLRGFFQEIPREIEEAARIDGCTRLEAFRYVMVPLASSGLLATFIFCFISAWNELMIPLVLSLTKTTSLTMYASAFGGLYEVNYGGAAAVSVLSSLPTVVLALVFRRYLVRGLLEGAVKK